MALISSITSTVLPTPAPPNIAALPPWARGASKSITLMPVSNRVVAEVSSFRAGGGWWMLRRGVPSGRGGPRSRSVPTTSSRRPRMASPTGTITGFAVARTRVPRARPDVGCNAMARTVRRSAWLWTSRASGSGRSHSTDSSVLTGGRAAPPETGANATSTTAPRTDTITPVRHSGGHRPAAACTPRPCFSVAGGAGELTATFSMRKASFGVKMLANEPAARPPLDFRPRFRNTRSRAGAGRIGNYLLPAR